MDFVNQGSAFTDVFVDLGDYGQYQYRTGGGSQYPNYGGGYGYPQTYPQTYPYPQQSQQLLGGGLMPILLIGLIIYAATR